MRGRGGGEGSRKEGNEGRRVALASVPSFFSFLQVGKTRRVSRCVITLIDLPSGQACFFLFFFARALLV